MRYVHARIEQDLEEYTYRLYMSDTVNGIGQGKYSKYRWADFIKPKTDNRSGNEIVMDVMRQAGLEFSQ